jgi:hypothetical protein
MRGKGGRGGVLSGMGRSLFHLFSELCDLLFIFMVLPGVIAPIS